MEASPLSILDVSQMESPLVMPPPPPVPQPPRAEAEAGADTAPAKKRHLQIDVGRPQQPGTAGAQLCFVEPSPHTPHDLARLDSIEGRPGTAGRMQVCPLTPKAARHRSRRSAYGRQPGAGEQGA